MTVPVGIVHIEYAGDGVTTAFPIPSNMWFQDEEDIKVYQTASQVTTELTSGFSVVGAGDVGGGTLNMNSAPASGTSIKIILDPVEAQEADYVENDIFPAIRTEDALDRLMRICQFLRGRTEQSLRVSDGEPALDVLPGPLDRASKVIGFDANGELMLTSLAITIILGSTPVSVSSIAMLRALPMVIIPTYVLVQGFYAAIDGGGGLFNWDAASTLPDDNGYTILPTAHVGAGRYRRMPTENTVDARYFGCIEGQSTAVQSAAFSAAVLYFQAQSYKFAKIRAVGTFTFDPTLFPYVTLAGFDKIVMAASPTAGLTDRAKVPTLEMGGIITFTTPFYVPQFWTVLGIGGQGFAQFQNGAACQIIGDVVLRGSNPRLENLFILGQLYLEGHLPALGQDAPLYLTNVSATLTGARATAGEAALRIYNKYEIWADNCQFNSFNGPDPTCAIRFEGDFQNGLTYLRGCTLQGGNIQFVNAAVGDCYFNFIHEGLNQPYLFYLAPATTGSALCGQIEMDGCQVADNAVAYKHVNVSQGTISSLTYKNSDSGFLGDGLWRIRHLKVDQNVPIFENSTISLDLAEFRQTHGYEEGGFDSKINSIYGKNCLPGYVKPTVKILANVPDPGLWTPSAAGAFDGISNAYTQNSPTPGGSINIHNSNVLTGASVVNDVIVVALWGKRNDQTNILPRIQLALLNTVGGAPAVDAFSATTLPYEKGLLDRMAGYQWWYGYVAFKLQVAANFYISSSLASITTSGTITVCDVTVMKITDALNAFEVHQLVMANQRYPSLITAGTPPTAYYSHVPGAYHALRNDVGFGSPAANLMALLPGNALLTGKGATGSRPAGTLPEGYQWFDSTLHKPVFADGAGGWKDAMNNAV